MLPELSVTVQVIELKPNTKLAGPLFDNEATPQLSVTTIPNPELAFGNSQFATALAVKILGPVIDGFVLSTTVTV